MNTEFFIAKRIFFEPAKYRKESKSFFIKPIISIAVAGIALGITVMVLSVAIVTGFKKEIKNKIVGFGADILITNFDNNSTYETKPISVNQHFNPSIEEFEGIKHIQAFAYKLGLIKTQTDNEGVVLKGIGPEFNWDFFEKHLVAGNIFQISDTAQTNKALISKYLANILKLKPGDDFKMYFAQNPPRMRKFTVEGIYETSLVDFDKLFVIVDIKHVQKLNNWDNNQVSGFEISIDNFDKLDEMTGLVYEIVGYNFTENSPTLKITNIKEKYIQIFDWLNLQDMNVLIILILILIVAGFNMVSGLLIIILDRTNMIGILKAIGATNTTIRKIFIYQSGFLILKGLIWGNVLGLSICFLQYYFKMFKLDQASYFLDTVPINFNYLLFAGLNIGTLVIIVLFLIIPSYVISNISPVKTIRFE